MSCIVLVRVYKFLVIAISKVQYNYSGSREGLLGLQPPSGLIFHVSTSKNEEIVD